MKYWIAYDDRSWYMDLFCLDINLQAAKPSLNNPGDIGFIYVQNHGGMLTSGDKSWDKMAILSESTSPKLSNEQIKDSVQRLREKN